MTEPQRQILRALPRTGSVSLATLATSVHGEESIERLADVFVELPRMRLNGWVTGKGFLTEMMISLTDAGRAVLDGAGR